MNWRRWLSIGLAIVLLLSASDTDLVEAEGQTSQGTVAYIDITDGWGTSYQYGSDSTQVVAENDMVTGDGTYTISVDFTQTIYGTANGIGTAKICIQNGEELFGTNSLIQILSLKLDGENMSAENTGYTYENQDGDTCMWLYDQYTNPYWESYASARIDDGSELQYEDTRYKPFGDSINCNFKKMEITFTFVTNSEADPDVTKDPNTTPAKDPDATKDPDITPTEGPDATKDPDVTPTEAPDTTKDPNVTPTEAPDAAEGSGASGTDVQKQSGNVVSNSAYTGPEKILTGKKVVVIPAGSSSTVTFALLRSAASQTKVTVSSANTGIALPTLQSDGRVRIQIPATAAAGSSTTVTLRFGTSSVSIKVTVRNPVTKIKAAKKSYKVKRKKAVKVVFNLTKKNKSTAATDEIKAKIAGKKATISSVKVSGSKVTVKVKGLKRGSATLKVSISGKTAKAKIRIK